MNIRTIALTLIMAASLTTVACSNRAAVGTAAGVGAAGVSYEAYNKKRLNDNEERFEKGEISREEYERRKDEIEDRSVVY